LAFDGITELNGKKFQMPPLALPFQLSFRIQSIKGRNRSEPVKRVFAILAGALVLLSLFVFFVEPLWMVPLLERMTPNILYRVRTEKPLVALSFDDGPNPEFTPQVLGLLEEYDARATFFLIGERAERNPELVRRILAEGNEVGNHWCRNGSVLLQPDKEFAEGLERTERAIGLAEGRKDNSRGPSGSSGRDRRQNLGGVEAAKATSSRRTPKFFRPPGGVARPSQLRLAKERGYTSVLGCAYPHDPMKMPVWYQRWLIEKNLAPGTIVILHDGIKDPTRSIETLRHILAEGKRRGLKFVSIGELVDKGNGEAGRE